MCYSPEQVIGLQGENLVLNKLRQLGHRAKLCPDFYAKSVDIVMNGMPIEVKTANSKLRLKKKANGSLVSYRRYQWNVSGLNSTHGEFPLVLVALDTAKIMQAFVVPASLVRGRGVQVVEINTHPTKYRGWFSEYLGAWWMIEQIYRDWYTQYQEVRA